MNHAAQSNCVQRLLARSCLESAAPPVDPRHGILCPRMLNHEDGPMNRATPSKSPNAIHNTSSPKNDTWDNRPIRSMKREALESCVDTWALTEMD